MIDNVHRNQFPSTKVYHRQSTVELNDLFPLEAMLNTFHTNNVVATSESDSEIRLARNTRQLPSQLAAQLPTVALKKSSDMHIGPRQQNDEPVTVNEYEYIRVKGENDKSLDQYPYDDIYTTTPQTPESGKTVDVALKHHTKNVMTFQEQAWLRNPYVWSLFVFVLVAAIIIAFIVSMSKPESNSAPHSKIPLGREHVVMCYLIDWAHRRPGQGKFTVDNIDPTLCTHLVYGYAVLNMTTNAIESSEPAYDLEGNNGTGAYKKMTSLKRDYPHLKLLLGMGAWETSWKKNYSEMAESPSRRMALVTSVSELLRKYNFDGLGLHWEYPALGKGVPADKENFVSLLKEFREEFDKFGLLLTAALGVFPDTIERSYDITSVSQYLHYMLALCYGYHSPSNRLTGPNAPLYPCCGDDDLNVESSINNLLRKGANPKKLVLGLPLFGRIYELKNPEAGVGFEKKIKGAGIQGPYKLQRGWWGYNEICLVVDNPTNNWTKYWDNVTHTPYAFKGDQFISYDDAISLTDKVELAVRKKIAGVAVNSLDQDDFHGSCNFGSSGSTGYPLMRAINNALDISVSWKKVPCTSRSSATNKPQNIDYN